ncbi:family 43 glycosylhydrolase [Jonesiaceae bacterium BS-20]|uniref:Family 43 glycosylhydrolase n=1 Tax=Jonesiaceae bacterium BS-20 TaxID=3120821 RepID=A0AAU7DW26_9MICO
MYKQIFAAITAGALAIGPFVQSGVTPDGALNLASNISMQVAASTADDSVAPEFTNPLTLNLTDGKQAQQCADPDIIRSQEPTDPHWYLFCTRDALHPDLTEQDGALRFFNIPTYRSTDLVSWDFVGESLTTRPAWIGDGDMWAPDITYIDGKYLLYYTATNTVTPGGSAIGVAVSDSPLGPWIDSGGPVVEPMKPVGGGDADKRWVYDPEVLSVGGTNYIYFGSYFGGVSVRTLSADGLTSDPESQVEIAISNRYEGTHVIERDGWFYLLASATNCCAGPVTGYGVFAGRSKSPMGPFVDKAGVPLTAGRVGGTPVLHQNGNQWVGTGHHTVVTDFAGQQWIVYHAVDRTQPYMQETGTYTRRPVLMDPLDWVDGWPVVRGGFGPSNSPIPGPAAQPGQKTGYVMQTPQKVELGPVITELSDTFDQEALAPQWQWNKSPAEGTVRLQDGSLSWDTQASDLNGNPDDPTSVLFEETPEGDFAVDVVVSMNLPPEGCCYNYRQAGLILAQDEANFIKLVTASIWETRQVEFAKRSSHFPSNYPAYGNGVGGPVGEKTHLRIIRTTSETETLLTGFSSLDGEIWEEAGTWTMELDTQLRIGLVSMGGDGFEATFDSVTVRPLVESSTNPNPDPNPDPTDEPTLEPSPEPTEDPGDSVTPGGSEGSAPSPTKTPQPKAEGGGQPSGDLAKTGFTSSPTAVASLVLLVGAGAVLLLRRALLAKAD